MLTINWYPCNDGVHPGDCGGDPNTMVADERDGQPAFSVWLEQYFVDMKWRWAAWDGSEGATSQELASGSKYDTQADAMAAAERWLDERDADSGSKGSVTT